MFGQVAVNGGTPDISEGLNLFNCTSINPPSPCFETILLTKTAAAQNEVTLSHQRVRGLYFLAVVFAATM